MKLVLHSRSLLSSAINYLEEWPAAASCQDPGLWPSEVSTLTCRDSDRVSEHSLSFKQDDECRVSSPLQMGEGDNGFSTFSLWEKGWGSGLAAILFLIYASGALVAFND